MLDLVLTGQTIVKYFYYLYFIDNNPGAQSGSITYLRTNWKLLAHVGFKHGLVVWGATTFNTPGAVSEELFLQYPKPFKDLDEQSSPQVPKWGSVQNFPQSGEVSGHFPTLGLGGRFPEPARTISGLLVLTFWLPMPGCPAPLLFHTCNAS